MVFAVVHSVRPVWNSITKSAERGLIYNPLETGTVQVDPTVFYSDTQRGHK